MRFTLCSVALAAQVDRFYCKTADEVVAHVIDLFKAIGRLPASFPVIPLPDPVFASRQTQHMLGRRADLQTVSQPVGNEQKVLVAGGPGNLKSALALDAGLQLLEQGASLAGVLVADLHGVPHFVVSCLPWQHRT